MIGNTSQHTMRIMIGLRKTRLIQLLVVLLIVAVDQSAVHARMFDPEVGRWTRRDPLGYVDGMNLYEYVSSIPIIHVDEFGYSRGLGISDCDDCLKKALEDSEIKKLLRHVYDNCQSNGTPIMLPYLDFIKCCREPTADEEKYLREKGGDIIYTTNLSKKCKNKEQVGHVDFECMSTITPDGKVQGIPQARPVRICICESNIPPLEDCRRTLKEELLNAWQLCTFGLNNKNPFGKVNPCLDKRTRKYRHHCSDIGAYCYFDPDACIDRNDNNYVCDGYCRDFEGIDPVKSPDAWKACMDDCLDTLNNYPECRKWHP